jgi:alginate O-acetyltransferase complex protein AlgJ
MSPNLAVRALRTLTSPGAPPVLNGAVLAVRDGRLSGWAADTADLQRRLSMDIYVDACLVRKCIADRWSGEAEAVLGDGLHGFEVQLPLRLLDGAVHYVSVAVSGVASSLPDGAHWSGSNTSQPDGTRFERMRWGEDAPELPGPCLIEGRDGWAFLCNDANGSLDQLLGDLLFTDADVRLYRDILLRRQESLRRLGIPYLFAIAPSKETIHRETLPQVIPAHLQPALVGQLAAALEGEAVRMVDLHAPLRSAALGGAEVYYRRDCHWNWEGGLIAARALLDVVRDVGVPGANLDERRISWISSSYRGDLVGKPRTRFLDGRLLNASGESEPDVLEPDRRPNLTAMGVRTLQTPERLEVSKTRPSVVLANEALPDAPRAIVYRDSFGEHVRPFLGAAFSWSAWLWRPSIDVSLIERERPDVVIQVVAERFLANIPTEDVLQSARGAQSRL